MSKLSGAMLASRDKNRRPSDYYPTPTDVTNALCIWLRDNTPALLNGTVWEPACGDGHMAAILHRYFPDVHATDIRHTPYTTARSPRATGGVDFLATTKAPTGTAFIITNPPFTLAHQFITHAMTFNRPFAMLLKSQFWHAKKRLPLFHALPPLAVLPLTWRPDFLDGQRGGSPTMDVCWTVWLPTPPNGNRTRYEPLPRPDHRMFAV